MATPQTEPTVMEQAIALIQRGETIQAEELVQSALRTAEQQFGPHSPQYANAQNDVASVLMYLRAPDRAAEALRKACAVYAPDDYEASKDRLTYIMNLGFALRHAGDLDEAEKVLRDGVGGRRLFYGRKHAGYGFGLEPLADLLLQKGKLDEALQLAEETVDIFWGAGHARIATALALRAEILRALGRDTPPFDGLDGLPDDIIAETGQAVLNRVDLHNPARPIRQVLDDLLVLVNRRLGEAHPLALAVLQSIANLERHLGDGQARVAAIRRVLELLDAVGDRERALGAAQGLGLALSESGQPEEAEQAYRDALVRAEALGNAAMRSQALRNYGLFLAEQKRRPEAEKWLREAVEVAMPCGDAEMLSRARIALGIFLQHGGDLETAKGILTEALQGINPGHPDAITARSHLDAVLSGSSCGCGDQGKAVADACREYILARVPPGVLSDLKVGIENNDLQVQVFLDHEPAPEELEQLQRVLHHGVEAFRRNLRQQV